MLSEHSKLQNWAKNAKGPRDKEAVLVKKYHAVRTAMEVLRATIRDSQKAAEEHVRTKSARRMANGRAWKKIPLVTPCQQLRASAMG